MKQIYSQAVESISVVCGEKVVATMDKGELVVTLKLVDISLLGGPADYTPGQLDWLIKSESPHGMHGESGRCTIRFSHLGDKLSGEGFYGSNSGGRVIFQGTGALEDFDWQLALKGKPWVV